MIIKIILIIALAVCFLISLYRMNKAYSNSSMKNLSYNGFMAVICLLIILLLNA